MRCRLCEGYGELLIRVNDKLMLIRCPRKHKRKRIIHGLMARILRIPTKDTLKAFAEPKVSKLNKYVDEDKLFKKLDIKK